MMILGIDPGKATGIALVDTDDLTNTMYTELVADCYPSSITVGCYLDAELSESSHLERLPIPIEDVNTIVIEDWEFRHTGYAVNANHAAGPIGVVEYIGMAKGITVIKQKPFKRSRITDDMLKRSGLWWPHGKGHARQAMKHVLTFLIAQRHQPTINLLFPREN